MRRFLLIVLIDILVFAGALTWYATAPGAAASSAVAISSTLTAPVVVLAAFYFVWRPIFAPYPPAEIAAGAERRRFQSIGVMIFNMTCCTHLATDDEYLHLKPILPLRVCGATEASIPWASLSLERGNTVRIAGGVRLTVPRWCLERVRAD